MNKTDAYYDRDQAIRGVERNADAEWLETAWAFLLDYMGTHDEVFCDDLWAAGLPEPREARALGALIGRASRQNLITKTGTYRESIRSHMSIKPLWRVVR